jgi:glycosyltransferase involved in cell wall biosynthesis
MRQMVRGALERLPETPRFHLYSVLLAQERAFRAWGAMFKDLGRGVVQGSRHLLGRHDRATSDAAEAEESTTAAAGFASLVRPGDILLTMGAFWSHPGYAAMLESQCKRLGLRYALLVYDIIAIRRPEWCDPGFVHVFQSFIDRILPLCDIVLAISRATAEDVSAYAHERAIPLSGPVVPIPMGSGFGRMLTAAETAPAPRSDRLPPPGGYALFVSTIEARKNHLLIFRVWRRLLEELPPERVPTMVFAGRVGWLVDDLMRQIANSNGLNGKLIVVEHPSDSELTALYQGCRFTVFPSLYEGWGLPVTESLAFGKPCLIADRTSLPEAGGTLARRFDPDNLHDAFEAIRDVILDPRDLARWEDQVRREFRPVPWTASAEALLAALGYAVTAPEAEGSARPEMALADTGGNS